MGAHENIRICFSFIYRIYVDYYGLFVWATGLQIIRYKAENARFKKPIINDRFFNLIQYAVNALAVYFY